jgi:hypothetical protein
MPPVVDCVLGQLGVLDGGPLQQAAGLVNGRDRGLTGQSAVALDCGCS